MHERETKQEQNAPVLFCNKNEYVRIYYMAFPKLFMGIIGLSVAAAGGVFVLVSQENPTSGFSNEIIKEAFVAGIDVQNNKEHEEQKEESPENLNSIGENKSGDTMAPEEREFSVHSQEPLEIQKPQEIPETFPEDSKEIPEVDEPREPSPPPAVQPARQVNINTANSQELQGLSGIGPVLASRVIDYRNQVSLFYDIEDIKNVSGVGDVTFQKIKNDITVGNVVAPDLPPDEPESVPVLPPVPMPTPTPSPAPQSEGHTFYTSSYHSSKLYYCDTDSGWENLSPTYLESYPSEEAVLAVYPAKTLHEPCE